MSLWTCPVHGLYGGDVFCPVCGGAGDYTVDEDGRSGASAPSGSQASPGAPDGSPPSVSIPNAVEFRRKGKLGYRTKVSRVRSVEVHLGRTRRMKRAWAIALRNRGHETKLCLSDDAMGALVALYEKINAIDRIRGAIGDCRTAVMHHVDYEWRFVNQDASGIVAATAGETEGLDERSEQSPVGVSRDAQTEAEG